MKKFSLLSILVFVLNVGIFAQLTLPRESSGATVTQTIGDTKVTIVYHRPNTKGRKIWGELVPYGEVWRSGANENTVFETSRDVTINGQLLPAGKYGFHTIPNKDEWILIFSKDNDKWGSFSYDAKQDALRVKVAPQKSNEMRETLIYEFEPVTNRSAQVVLSWEKLRVPFTIDIGDVYARSLEQIREAIKNRKEDDMRPLSQGASYVLTYKLKENYDEAIGWLDTALKIRETFGGLAAKARILAETGKIAEAVSVGEKAVAVGKAANPPANTSDFEKTIAEWKAKMR